MVDCFVQRAVFSKIAMSGKDQGENMDAANTFAVVTMLATVSLRTCAICGANRACACRHVNHKHSMYGANSACACRHVNYTVLIHL
jgi:hypothetical protein